MTRKPIGFAVRTAIQVAALGAAALSVSFAASSAEAQDLRVAEVQPFTQPTFANAEPLAAPAVAATNVSGTLTPDVLAAYVARQQAQKGFDIFGEAPQPQLTSAMVSAYAATHYQNAALSAIDDAAAPMPLAVSYTTEEDNPDVLAADAEAAPPSVDGDALARYARLRFQPTAKKVELANKEKNCLASAIYHEARGESDNGQWAVANVIINRAMSKRFPSTMCGVIYQNADQGRFHCQFTFACDGHADEATERRAWSKASQIAVAAFSEFQHGERPGVLPGSALYYHTRAVSPSWSNSYKQVAQIGAHVFYSPL